MELVVLMRERREHVTVSPVSGAVMPWEIGCAGGDNEWVLGSAALIESLGTLGQAGLGSECVTAPVEFVVTQQGPGDVSYTLSFVESMPNSVRSAFESVFEQHYAVQHEAGHPFEFLGEMADCVEVGELWVPGAFETRVPKFPTGEVGFVCASLIEWLREWCGTWVLQVLAVPCTVERSVHPVHAGEAVVRLQIRLAVVDGDDDRGVPSLRSVGEPPADTALRMTREVGSGVIVEEMLTAQLRGEQSFVAPARYAHGVMLPPGREVSLRRGVPETTSRYRTVPSGVVAELVEPELPVGTEPMRGVNPWTGASVSFSDVSRVGVSGDGGVVLRVEAEAYRQVRTVQHDLVQHLRRGVPTVVVAESESVQARCVEAFCAHHDACDVTAAVESVHMVRGDEVMEIVDSPGETSDRVADWFRGGTSLVVVDAGAVEQFGEVLTGVLAAVARGAAGGDADASGGGSSASVVAAGSWPLWDAAEVEGGYDQFCAVLEWAVEAGVTVSVQTLYPGSGANTLWGDWTGGDAVRDAAYRRLADLSRRADAVLMNPVGPVPRVTADGAWPNLAGPVPQAVVDDDDREAWVGVFDVGAVSVAVPVMRLAAAPDPAAVSLDTNGSAVVRAAVTSDTDGAGDADGVVVDRKPSLPERTAAIRDSDAVPVTFDAGKDGYVCDACRAASDRDADTYDSSLAGFRAAMTCCHGFDDIDRDTVRRVPEPVLGLREEVVDDHELSRKALRFLAVLYLVQAGKCDTALEFDPACDSTITIRNDLDVDYELETQLVDDGYIVRTMNPSKVYSLTRKGVEALGGEPDSVAVPSMFERRLFRAAELYLTADYADDPTVEVETQVSCPVVATDSAHPSRTTLPVGVRRDGSVVAGIGVYRSGTGLVEPSRSAGDDCHDGAGEVDADVAATDATVVTYQALASPDIETALWCVSRHEDATELVSLLHAADMQDLAVFDHDGYDDGVRIQDYDIDEPGFTDVKTVNHLLNAVDPSWDGRSDRFKIVLSDGGEADE